MSVSSGDLIVCRWLPLLKGKLSFVKELAGGLLPTHTEQEIRDHEAWYQQYMQLNDRKREVIQRWREKKEVVYFLCCIITIHHPSVVVVVVVERTD